MVKDSPKSAFFPWSSGRKRLSTAQTRMCSGRLGDLAPTRRNPAGMSICSIQSDTRRRSFPAWQKPKNELKELLLGRLRPLVHWVSRSHYSADTKISLSLPQSEDKWILCDKTLKSSITIWVSQKDSSVFSGHSEAVMNTQQILMCACNFWVHVTNLILRAKSLNLHGMISGQGEVLLASQSKRPKLRVQRLTNGRVSTRT